MEFVLSSLIIGFFTTVAVAIVLPYSVIGAALLAMSVLLVPVLLTLGGK